MHKLSDNHRSTSCSQTSGQIGNTSAFTSQGESFIQNLIIQANSIPLNNLFNFYKISINPVTKMTVCPFKSHKGGREQTPSFKYYAHSNSFNCFGCKIGGGGCQLVMNLENCSKIQAAEKIMARWGEDCTNDGDVFNSYSYQNQEERFKLLLKFSQIMRDFYSVYQTPCALAHMEQACQKFDSLFFKRNLSDEAITRIIEQMQIHLSYFKP